VAIIVDDAVRRSPEIVFEEVDALLLVDTFTLLEKEPVLEGWLSLPVGKLLLVL